MTETARVPRAEFVHDGATVRFWLGNKPIEYIDVTPFGDLHSGQFKLEALGGSPTGLTIQPRSGNNVYIGLSERSR